jgi:hypothetical protein
MNRASTSPDLRKRIRWSKRVGLVAFLFLLGKGLLWLAIFAAAARHLR